MTRARGLRAARCSPREAAAAERSPPPPPAPRSRAPSPPPARPCRRRPMRSPRQAQEAGRASARGAGGSRAGHGAEQEGSHVPREEQKTALRNPASDTGQRDSKSIQSSSEHANTPGDDNEILPPRKLYTVSLPPEGYIPVSPNTINDPDSESSESNKNTAEEDYQGQPKRKRTRRKKQKNTLQNPGNLHGEQTELEKHGTLFQDNLQLQQTDSPRISKNKKRKMKKKRQKEKMRAGGLLTKNTCVDFTYQPDKSNSDGGVDFEDIDEKADGILDFLQATREIYFTDKHARIISSLFHYWITDILPVKNQK